MSGSTASVWGAETWRLYRRLLGYTRRYWPVGVVTILGMVADSGSLVVFTNFLRPIIDKLFAQRDPYLIFWMPIWIVLIFMVRAIGVFVSNYGINYIGRNVVQSMQRDVFAAYQRLPAAFFGAEQSGHQISRITYTSEQVAAASTEAISTTITQSVLVVGMFITMLRNSAYLTLVLFVMVPAVVLIVGVVSRRYRQITRRLQDMMGSVVGVVDESVSAYREVRVYGGQKDAENSFENITNRSRRLNLKVAATTALSSATVQMAAAVTMALLIYIGTRPSTIDHISSGVFITVFTAMAAMLPPLKRLTNVQSHIQRGVSAAEDLFRIIDMPPEADSGTMTLQRASGDIRFEDVSLVYPKGEHVALRGVHLHCEPGKVTALVGRSGSGKSSLVSLLPRFYDPAGGRILLDGEDYRHFTRASLRRQIAWVGQSMVLFDGTIAENIAYGELAGAAEADIIAAAESANAMEFIRQLPNGIHAQVGENGNSLSGGQRQRIAIARAILKNAPILILDEATSALDTESERLIQQALQKLMQSRTTLVIAHRLSTIEHADQIAVMEQGRIVERGTHTELLAQDGRYAMLHRMQFNESPPPGVD